MIDDNIAAESINWWSPAAVCVLLSFVDSSFSPSSGQFGRIQTMRCSFVHSVIQFKTMLIYESRKHFVTLFALQPKVADS